LTDLTVLDPDDEEVGGLDELLVHAGRRDPKSVIACGAADPAAGSADPPARMEVTEQRAQQLALVLDPSQAHVGFRWTSPARA
jgi:hypothetical protein